MVETLVKLGGSVIDSPELEDILDIIAKSDTSLAIVPGGGAAADHVRMHHREHGLSNKAAHFAAIKAMDLNAIMLEDLLTEFNMISNIDNAGPNTVFECSDIIADSKLKPSWGTTSDTIAAYIAGKIGAKQLLKITDVDGILDKNNEVIPHIDREDVESYSGTCLDSNIHNEITNAEYKLHVINGRRPAVLEKFLNGEEVTCTRIE